MPASNPASVVVRALANQLPQRSNGSSLEKVTRKPLDAIAAVVTLSGADLRAQRPEFSGRSGLPDHIVEYVNRRVPALLAQTKVPGLAIAVVRDGGLVWRRAYGVADIETQTPITDNTIFEA